MSSSKNLTILYGDDEESIAEYLSRIEQEQIATGLADLNFSKMDGRNFNEENFFNTVMAMPILSPYRQIILTNPLALASGKDGNKKMLRLLESVPPTTHIVLVITDDFERKDWLIFGKTSFLRKWAEKNSEKAEIIEKRKPAVGMMRDWIIKKTIAMGGQIEPQAAQILVTAVGNDTRAAKQELEKLLLYVNYGRPIDSMDIQELVTGSASVSIFDMVDALASGNAKEAFRTLDLLMQDQEIPVLFAMIIRQFRLLIQTREIMDEKGNIATVQDELNQHPFVAEKLWRQASRFRFLQLKSIYRKLVEMDFAFKTSQPDSRAALDVLIADISLMVQD